MIYITALKNQRKRQEQRERNTADTSQKWKDKTQPSNWQVVQDYIKLHKEEPDKLDGYGEKRLRESGVVSERRIEQAGQIRRKEVAVEREEMV